MGLLALTPLDPFVTVPLSLDRAAREGRPPISAAAVGRGGHGRNEGDRPASRKRKFLPPLARPEGDTMLSQELLDILVCPACKGDLKYEPQPERLICPACKLAYPVRDDIPIMLPEEAERLEGGRPGEEGGTRD
jgi:hypothetical protein